MKWIGPTRLLRKIHTFKMTFTNILTIVTEALCVDARLKGASVSAGK